MTQQIHLRPYTADDENETVMLWIATWQAVYPEMDLAAGEQAMRSRWRDEIVPPAVVTLAVADARIVGVITVDLGTGYVDQLAVAPDMWGAAVGAMLLDEAKRLSPAMVYLRVNQDNARAIRFYDKHGFFQDGEAFNRRIGKPQYIMRWRPSGGQRRQGQSANRKAALPIRARRRTAGSRCSTATATCPR